MFHLRCKLLTLLALLITLNMQKTEVNAGPLSLSFARSFRSGREIRAPFKTSDIMVARGFGKRNNFPVSETSKSNAAINSMEKSTSSAGNIIMTPDNLDIDGIQIDLMASEFGMNPNLARLILHRFVDSNGDGRITTHELSHYPLENFEYY